MVTTLIKHEFLRTRGWLAVVFGAATILLLAGLLMELTPWGIVQSLGSGLTLVPVVSLSLVVQVTLAFDYWRSSYSRTGYFTQSLPVKGSTIYGVKLLWGSLITIVAVLVNIVMGGAALLGASRVFVMGVTLPEILDTVASMLAATPVWASLLVAAFALVVIVGTLVQYFFAASIGSEGRNNKLGIGGPIVVWFILYVVMQVLLLVGIVAVPLGLDQSAVDGSLSLVPRNFLSLILSNEEPDMMPLGFIPVFLLATGALMWRTVVSWNKKVSLA
ncbi:MAG: hypothetical protein ACTHU1_12135 [Arachnia sp.]